MDTGNQPPEEQPGAGQPPAPTEPPAYTPPPQPYTPPPMQPATVPGQPVGAAEITSNDRLWGALSYLLTPIVPVIVLVMEDVKNRTFPRYHAIQGLGFAALILIYEIVAGIVFTICSAVTLGLAACVLWILFFLPIIPAIIYTVQAYQGQYIVIPWLTNFMVQQGWLQRP